MEFPIQQPNLKENQADSRNTTASSVSRPSIVRPGLARVSFVSNSLRNATAAISSHLLAFVASQKSAIQFHVASSELSNLAAERTPLAMAEILERALDGEVRAQKASATAGEPPQGECEASTAGLGESKTFDGPAGGLKSIGTHAAKGSAQYDTEAPTDQRQFYCSVKNLITKIRLLEGQPITEIVKHQRRVAAEAAANTLATLVLKSSPETGLNLSTNPEQLQQRRAAFGANAIAPKRLTTFFEFCWEAVQDFVLLMLICLGVVSIIVESTIAHGPEEKCKTCWIEGAAILFAVFIVVMVTSSIDYTKQKTFVKLSKTLEDSNTKSVIRNGQVVSVVDAEIVVGDILSVNSHNSANIPADCVLLGPSSGTLQIDEASLTGESKLVSKQPGDVVLSGTVAVQGSGKMVVIAVGVNSVAGKIKARVYESEEKGDEENLEGDEETPLFAKLSLLAKQIGMAGTAAAILAFLASLVLGLAVKKDPPQMIVEYFIVAVTVLAVSVPEGLPLAVTLALAFSSQRMTKYENLVKHLDACETMGCATTICTDKTGTLTANKMTARAMHTNEHDFVCPSPSIKLGSMLLDASAPRAPSAQLLGLIVDAISIATMNESVLYFKEGNDKRIVTGSEGNPTECALLSLVEDLGFHYIDIRNQTRGRSDAGPLAQYLAEGKQFEFSSARKMMSWAVPLPTGGFRIYCKGASEVIFSRCTRILLNEGESPLTDKQRDAISTAAERYAQRGMRCLSLAYRDLPRGADWDDVSDELVNADGTPANEVETNLVFFALVGIEDPLRPEVPDAIQKCYEAGIDVRMVTGDNRNTAVSIAHQAGILRDVHFKPVTEGQQQHYVADNLKENVLLEGKTFREKVYRTVDGKREFDQGAFDKIWPHLRVLARSSPDDKLTLAHGLNQSALYADKERVRQLLKEDGIKVFPDRQVIAMTGDGTNDAPALKRADIGFAMGIAGTQIAKDAADIILLNDNFASIVTAAKWGRNVYASIQKFLQFQLTVNIAAVTTALVGSFAYQTSPLAAIQLLWVNLLMDSLASLALASEPPKEELLKKPPVNRSEYLISNRMWVNMFGHAFYQIAVVLVLLFDGPSWFGFPPGHCLFNEVNCRNLKGEFNVFRGVFRNPLFCSIWITTAVLQVIMVQFGSYALAVADGGLDLKYWGLSMAFGLGSYPVQQLINIIFRYFQKMQLYRNRRHLKINAELLHWNISDVEQQ